MHDNLRALRRSKRLTLQGLAAQVGTSPSMLTFIERYGHTPGPELRQRIAQALGVPETDLWQEGDDE